MQKFALIGKTLKHSYSKKIHALLGSYDYDLVELESGELKDFVLRKEYKGFNVTIPYKKDIIPYLYPLPRYRYEVCYKHRCLQKRQTFWL